MAEELKGQLAESLPNAVGIFADALYGNGKAGSGDKKKLFKDMEDGKVGLQELTKVIEYMGTLSREDLIAKMLDTPAKKLAKLKTQWIYTLESLNDAGFIDMMITALEKFTELLVDLTVWINKNKQEIKEWSAQIISTFKWVISNLPLITSLWMSFKISAWLTAATAGATTLSTALSGLLLRFIVMPLLVGAAIASIIEFYDTVNGKNTLIKALSEEKDKGFIGYFAAITRSVLDFARLMVSPLVTGAMWAYGKLTGDQFLVDAAIQTANAESERFAQNQKAMGFGDNTEEGRQQRKAAHMEKFNAYLAYKERAVDTSGGAFSMVPARYRQMSYDAQQQTQPTTFSPTIQINTTSTDPEKHAQLVTVAIEDWYTKKLFTAASNYSPTPSLNN